MTDAIDATDTPTPRRKPKPEVTTLNNHELKPSTLMMGHGFDPVPFGRVAQTADLPHLNLCVPERRRWQAPLRRDHRQTRRRRGRPRLFALQRPEPGNPRGSPWYLGRSRRRADILERHDSNLHPDDGLCQPRRRHRALRPALCRV